MAKINLGYDLGDADRDGGSDLIPAGLYLTEIARVELKEGTDGKSDSLWVNHKVLDAQSAANKKYVGSKFLDILSLSEKANFRMAGLCDAAFGRRVKGDTLDTGDLEGKKVVVQTKEEEYNGQIRTKVDRYTPVSRWEDPVSGKTDGDTKGENKIGGDDDEVDL